MCPYCDFVVYGGSSARGPSNRIGAVVDALVTEIEVRGRAAPLRSVYLGGGTPSLMSAEQVSRILAAADSTFGIAPGAEITIEVNPALSDRGDISGFAAAGVNRLSIGAQSLHALELRALGRRHSPADVAATVAAARDAAIDNISVDLLYDVPGQTLASWRDTLHGTLDLRADHVSAYALTLDDHGTFGDRLAPSAGAARWRARARAGQDEDVAAEMYELADDLLGRAGLPWYEISNWALPGAESRHNMTYWHNEPWEAVGPGAHRFDGATRTWNSANLGAYVASLAVRELPPGAGEISTPDEAIVLGLRTSKGVPGRALGSALAWARAEALVEPAQHANVRLTRRGRLLSNELFSRLLPAQERSVA